MSQKSSKEAVARKKVVRASVQKKPQRTLYSEGDFRRPAGAPDTQNEEPYRSPWRRDYARLIHCPSFRRLQGKTQVFPGYESDFYRNRLTHSMEVAQIAKSIAIRLNATAAEFRNTNTKIEPEIVEFAGLAHDLGHPPFGHNGEEALDECMCDHGGFEGNAQTLRIVSRLEKKVLAEIVGGELKPFGSNGEDLRRGLNLTYRSLASLLKYSHPIPERKLDRKEDENKGYYYDDGQLVKEIITNVLGEPYDGKFKTIECSIMDIADDIAYSTYDIEDNFKAGFLTPADLFGLDPDIYVAVADTINKRIIKYYSDYEPQIEPDWIKAFLHNLLGEILFQVGPRDFSLLRDRTIPPTVKKMLSAAEVQLLSRRLAQDGYARVEFTSKLIHAFINGVEVVKHPMYPQLHRARLDFWTFLHVEVLKNITFEAVIRAPNLQVVQYRGKDIVSKIFSAIIADKSARLLPNDFRLLCKNSSEMTHYRTVCDFIAGMTDRYAFEFYSRLYGTDHLTVHKPL
jgi:dGTPase